MLHIELDWTWQFSAFGFFDASLQPRKEAKLPKASHLIPLSTNVSCTRQFSWPFGHVTLQMSMEILFHTNFTSPMSMDSLGIFRSSCDLWTKRNSRPYWLASWVKSVAIPRQRWAVLFKYLPVPPSASHVWSFTKFHSRTRSCCLCTSAWTTRHQPWSCSHTFRFHPGPQHFWVYCSRML